jgi:hypothetical protein
VVDALARGVNVPSCYVQLSRAGDNERLAGHLREYCYAGWSGTSFAAPRLAGVLASELHGGLAVEDAKREALGGFARRRGDRY